VSVEVIDLRTLNPLDEDTVYDSVRKTNRALLVHEDTLTAGFGAEIAARIAEHCFEHLDAPIMRVAAMDIPVPYSPPLEDAMLPNKQNIITCNRTSCQILKDMRIENYHAENGGKYSGGENSSLDEKDRGED